MIFLKLSELIKLCEIADNNFDIEAYDPDIVKISSDIADIEDGSAFVCIKGMKYDTHKYLDEIAGNDPAVVFMQDAEVFAESGIPSVLVKNTRKTLARLWSAVCGDPGKRLKLFAVTGTNGKSSTVGILKSIFEYAGCRCASLGTVNMPMTTPDPGMLYPKLKECADSGIEYVFMEASSHALYFDKLDPLEFEGGIFTNLTPEHLDFHGNMNSYASAKSKLFSTCRLSVINADGVYAEKMASSAGGIVRFYSPGGKDADYSAGNIRMSLSGCLYDFITPEGVYRIRANGCGEIALENTLAAAALADSAGVDIKYISAGIGAYRGAPGRFEEIPVSGKFRVFIDYAHTPDALEKLLSGVKKHKRRTSRLVTVFGCGGDRDKSKRAVMGRIASRYSDFSIITSDNSRSENPYKIIADIMEGFDIRKPFVIIADRRQAIEYAVRSARRGDVILLCGKGHEDYEIDENGRHPFSEKDILKSLAAGT